MLRFALMLTVLLVSGLALAACGGDDGDNGDATGDDPAEGLRQTIEAATTRIPGETPDDSDSPEPGEGGLGGEFEVVFLLETNPSPENEQLRTEAAELDDDIEVEISNGEVTMSGEPPFITLTGTIDEAGNFNVSGSGPFGAIANATATFEGTITETDMEGTYTLEADGQTIEFAVAGPKDVD
jgi:hypothetical protein